MLEDPLLVAWEARKKAQVTTQRAPVRGGQTQRGPPSNSTIVKRWSHLKRQDRYLRIADDYHRLRQELTGSEGHKAWSCVWRDTKDNKRIYQPAKYRFTCRAYEVCTYCAARRAEEAALNALARHGGAPTVYHFSISFPPAVRTDLGAVIDARKALIKAMRDMGFDRRQIHIHQFGENIADGPKYHLDGLASSMEEMELHHDVPPLKDKLAPWFMESHMHMHSQRIQNANVELQAKRIAGAARYSGRSTWPTAKLWAGEYENTRGQLCYRLTDMGKTRNTEGAPLRLKRPYELTEIATLTPQDMEVLLPELIDFRKRYTIAVDQQGPRLESRPYVATYGKGTIKRYRLGPTAKKLTAAVIA